MCSSDRGARGLTSAGDGGACDCRRLVVLDPVLMTCVGARMLLHLVTVVHSACFLREHHARTVAGTAELGRTPLALLWVLAMNAAIVGGATWHHKRAWKDYRRACVS